MSPYLLDLKTKRFILYVFNIYKIILTYLSKKVKIGFDSKFVKREGVMQREKIFHYLYSRMAYYISYSGGYFYAERECGNGKCRKERSHSASFA